MTTTTPSTTAPPQINPEIPPPPVDTFGIEELESKLVLTYLNEAGTTVVRRIIKNTGDVVAYRDKEYSYNYSEEEWQLTHSPPAYKYNLADDRETLIGDGSNWDGVGHDWKSWFEKQHYHRLSLRFPHDDIQ